MEGTGRTIVYAIAAACILGMIIIGALVLTSDMTEEEITELYFENLNTLPHVIQKGDKIDFAFTLSHGKKADSL